MPDSPSKKTPPDMEQYFQNFFEPTPTLSKEEKSTYKLAKKKDPTYFTFKPNHDEDIDPKDIHHEYRDYRRAVFNLVKHHPEIIDSLIEKKPKNDDITNPAPERQIEWINELGLYLEYKKELEPNEKTYIENIIKIIHPDLEKIAKTLYWRKENAKLPTSKEELNKLYRTTIAIKSVINGQAHATYIQSQQIEKYKDFTKNLALKLPEPSQNISAESKDIILEKPLTKEKVAEIFETGNLSDIEALVSKIEQNYLKTCDLLLNGNLHTLKTVDSGKEKYSFVIIEELCGGYKSSAAQPFAELYAKDVFSSVHKPTKRSDKNINPDISQYDEGPKSKEIRSWFNGISENKTAFALFEARKEEFLKQVDQEEPNHADLPIIIKKLRERIANLSDINLVKFDAKNPQITHKKEDKAYSSAPPSSKYADKYLNSKAPLPSAKFL